MKHVLQLRFLVLFNVWWISWNVFVCANEESNSSSNEPETSVSGLVETGALLTTISERTPNYTNTIVVTLRRIYTSDDISEGQSSQEVTSTKPLKPDSKGKSVTTDRSLSNVTGNEEHSRMTTQRQENGENGSIIKTSEKKNISESFNSQSVSYGEVTTNEANSVVNETESTATERSLSIVTRNEEEHSRVTTEWQENNESTIKINMGNSTFDSFNSQSLSYKEVTTTAGYSMVNETQSATTDRNLSSVTGINSSMTTEQLDNSENVSKTVERNSTIESFNSQSVSYGEVTTNAVYSMVNETQSATTDRNLSSVTGNSEHSSMTTERLDNSENVNKTVERNSTIESLVSQSVNYGEVTTTGAYSVDGSSVTRMTSEQNNETDVTADYVTSTFSQRETSIKKKEDITKQMIHLTSASRENTVTEDQVKTSEVSQGFTAQTSLLQFQSTTPFPTEDPLAPTNITSVNVTDTSVTLQWFQAGLATSFSVTVKRDNKLEKQLNIRPPCLGEISNETISTNCTWTWVSFLIPELSEAGVMYNSTIFACFWNRCENASHTFQTAPAHPGEIEHKTNTLSVNVSWYQKGVADNFIILVNDPSARVRWTSDVNKNPRHVQGFIEQLSTPGQRLNVTITALSGHLRSKSRTTQFNTKPSTPGSLVMFDCHVNNLCIQWNQFGSFDSYVISVNGSKAEISCWNSSDTTENQTTVNCTVHHDFPSGSYTTLSVAVKSGSETSDEMRADYVKEPAKPEGLHAEIVNTSTVCFSWNQTGSYDEFDIQVSLPNHNYSANLTIPSDGLIPMWCVYDLPCPGAAYSLHVATVSHGKRSDFQSLAFRSAVDYVVMCGSKTKESLVFSIRPNMIDDSCPSFKDVERIEYSYHPANNESCSNPVENSTVFTNTVLNGARNTNVTGLIGGVTYQVTVWAFIDSIKSKEHVINCTTTVDYLVTCGSKTSKSFELSIQPDKKNDLCPSFEGIERIKYTYQPVNNESCSNQLEKNTVFYNTVLNGTRNTTVTGLIAGVIYQVTVWAFIDSIKSEEQVINCTTKPNPPSGLRTLNVSSTNMILNWRLPEGCFTDFFVQCIGQKNAANDSKPEKEANVMCENLTPGALYNVTVSSRLGDNTPSKAESLQFVTVPMLPDDVKVDKNLVDGFQLSVQYDKDQEKWQCTHFHFKVDGINETNPCTIKTHNLRSLDSNTFYDISISTVSSYPENNLQSTSVDSKFVSSWTLPKAVFNLNVTSSTVNSLTLEWIQPDKNITGIRGYNLMLQNSSEYQQNITLNCSTVFNCTNKMMTYELKNLTPNTSYTITIWAVNEGGVSEKQDITKQTLDPPGAVYVLTAALIGIIACSFVVFILTVFILIVLLRKKTKFAVPSARRPSDGLGFHNPTFTPDACESMKPKPILLDNFIEYLDELHSDSDLRFSAEYALLTELSPKLPQTAAEMEENRTKNRYSNILPFDHSRVKLIPLDDDDQGSDYINASYMPGYVSKREFIAAQGPMKSTVDDFWRMIWEQHISTIVMVTNLQERGREKCAEYWPTDEEPVFYGDLQVQMKSESQLNYYIIRILDVKLGEKKRVVKHLHFISWPDFGCPENTAVLLDFVLGVRAHAPSQPLQGCGPILVHCSAGVGRTGTFILVDHLLQRMRGHKTLDIFGLVLDMRSYRCNMLQTEAQYVFAHECIKTAIERQMISSFRNSTIEEEDEECMYQNVDRKDKLQEEEECVYQNCKNNVDGAPV